MEVDDTQTFQQQALEIREPAPDFDPTIKPENGEEYLMHMLYERKRCPAVVVKRPKKCVNSVPSVLTQNLISDEFATQTTCASLLPTVEWKAAQREDFIKAREKIIKMRRDLTANNYNSALEPPLITDAAEWHKFCCENPPLLRIVLRLNQRTLESLLEMLCEWLSEDETITPEEEQDNETTADQSSTLCVSSSSSAAAAAAIQTAATISLDLSNSEQWLGAWIYATLVCLHLPIEPDVHSTLRDIARACIRLRNRLQPQELEKAVPYNLFIHLIASVFDQLDFSEFV